MKLKTVYLLLCVAGIAVPYWQFVRWVMQNGLNLPLFWHQLFANRISAFFGMDVLVSSIVLLVFVRASGSLRGPRRWLPLIAVLTVGVSLALPLFLCMNEQRKEQARLARSTAAA
jgi:hypothetical protein